MQILHLLKLHKYLVFKIIYIENIGSQYLNLQLLE